AFLAKLELLEVGRRHRNELAEPAREPAAKSADLQIPRIDTAVEAAEPRIHEHRKRIVGAKPRRSRLVSDAVFALQAGTLARQLVAVNGSATHMKDDRLIVDGVGLVDARDDDAPLWCAVERLAVALADRAGGEQR